MMKLPYLLSSYQYQYTLRNRDARPPNSSPRFSQQNNFAIVGFMYFPDRLQLTKAGKCYLPCGYPPEKVQISDEAQMPKCSLDISQSSLRSLSILNNFPHLDACVVHLIVTRNYMLHEKNRCSPTSTLSMLRRRIPSTQGMVILSPWCPTYSRQGSR